MPIPAYSQIHPGTPVPILLKADQSTGRQVQGTVADILTHGDHPRGVKVRLRDGHVGRVQQILAPETTPPSATDSRYAPPSGPPPQQPRTLNAELPRDEDVGEQVETMQEYEAQVPASEDDRNQALLQKEFPGLDGSLIAAIYGDRKGMGEVRETLQELSGGA